MDPLLAAGQRRNLDRMPLGQPIDDAFDKDLRRRRPRRQADGRNTLDPGRVELACIGDEIAWHARFLADFPQTVRIRTVVRAYDQDNVSELREVAHRALTILR